MFHFVFKRIFFFFVNTGNSINLNSGSFQAFRLQTRFCVRTIQSVFHNALVATGLAQRCFGAYPAPLLCYPPFKQWGQYRRLALSPHQLNGLFLSLDAMEFIRRFLLHVLPSGFQKIRYYGFLSNRNQKTKLLKCFRLTRTPVRPKVKLFGSRC